MSLELNRAQIVKPIPPLSMAMITMMTVAMAVNGHLAEIVIAGGAAGERLTLGHLLLAIAATLDLGPRALHEALVLGYDDAFGGAAHLLVTSITLLSSRPVGELRLDGDVGDAVLRRGEVPSNGVEERRVLGGAHPRQDDVTGGDDLGAGQPPDVKLVHVLHDGKLPEGGGKAQKSSNK